MVRRGHCSISGTARPGPTGHGRLEVCPASHATDFSRAESMNSPVLGFAGQGRSGRRRTGMPWTARREPTGW